MNLAWIRRAASKNLAWTLAAAVAIVAIAAYAMMSRKKERMAPLPRPGFGPMTSDFVKDLYNRREAEMNTRSPMQRWLADRERERESRRRAASGCPFSFQTRGKDGKCRGCPPNTVWDGRQCKPLGKCRYSFQTMGKDGKCRGCPPDRPVWDGRNCVPRKGGIAGFFESVAGPRKG